MTPSQLKDQYEVWRYQAQHLAGAMFLNAFPANPRPFILGLANYLSIPGSSITDTAAKCILFVPVGILKGQLARIDLADYHARWKWYCKSIGVTQQYTRTDLDDAPAEEVVRHVAEAMAHLQPPELSGILHMEILGPVTLAWGKSGTLDMCEEFGRLLDRAGRGILTDDKGHIIPERHCQAA